MKIDKIYIINLKHRTDRKKEMINELNSVNATNYEFFNAIRPKMELINHWNPNFLNPMPQWFNGDENNYKIGALGCMLSHIAIMKKALKEGFNNILILEDDTEFIIKEDLNTLIDKYSIFLNNIDFGIFYLAGNNSKHAVKNIVGNIYLTYGTLTTGSYIINKSTMQYVVDNINKYPKEIDKYFVENIQTKFNCFVLSPPLTKQRASYSDIICRLTDYDLTSLK